MEEIQTQLGNATSWGQKLLDMGMEYAPKVLLALVTLFIGLRIIKWITKILDKNLQNKNSDQTLRSFLGNLVSWILKVMLFISVASMFGVQTTSFVAILGAAGLAVGLALQGSLQNFAGGVLLLLFKPYKVGDLIEAQGHLGVVKEIQIFTTILTSLDNKTIIVPNGAMSNGSITNYTTLGVIRVDLAVSVAHGTNLSAVKESLERYMVSHPKVLKDPKPFVGVLELNNDSIKMAVRPYAHPDEYWDVYFDVNEAVKAELTKIGVSNPIPALNVAVKNN